VHASYEKLRVLAGSKRKQEGMQWKIPVINCLAAIDCLEEEAEKMSMKTRVQTAGMSKKETLVDKEDMVTTPAQKRTYWKTKTQKKT